MRRNAVSGKPAETVALPTCSNDGIPPHFCYANHWCYYVSFINTTDNSSCFHIYLSPYFTNYATFICKSGACILVL